MCVAIASRAAAPLRAVSAAMMSSCWRMFFHQPGRHFRGKAQHVRDDAALQFGDQLVQPFVVAGLRDQVVEQGVEFQPVRPALAAHAGAQRLGVALLMLRQQFQVLVVDPVHRQLRRQPFELGPDLERFADGAHRRHRHHGAAGAGQRDGAARLQEPQGLADGRAAGLEFGGQLVLAQRVAGQVLAIADPLQDFFRNLDRGSGCVSVLRVSLMLGSMGPVCGGRSWRRRLMAGW